MNEGVHLLDADGQPFDHYNVHDDGGDNLVNDFDFTFVATNLKDTQTVPARMVLEIPTKVRQVVVPIEFKDLALP